MKKYQVFVSSTYTDLIEERQLAVSSILNAGHIPAGMELFKAGLKQVEVIKRWIDDSDIYMLILGGRYGTMMRGRDISYIEMEYRYAIERKKPVFALVLGNAYLDAKAAKAGVNQVFETEHPHHYNLFKTFVMSKLVGKVETIKDIAAEIPNTINDIILRHEDTLKGWIKADAAAGYGAAVFEATKLGIEHIYYNQTIPPISDKEFATAKTIKIIITSGPVFFRVYGPKLKLSLNNNADIKILLAKPNSAYVKEIHEMQRFNPEFIYNNNINREIVDTKNNIQDLYNSATGGTVSIGHFNTHFRCNAFIVDNVAYCMPIFLPKKPSDTVSFKVRGGLIYEDCLLHFDTMFALLAQKGAVRQLTKLPNGDNIPRHK